MNKETKLPKGWEVKILGEVCDKISLNGIKIKQKDYLKEGKFPVIDQGQEIIGGFFNDDKLVIPSEPPYIIFGDHTKVKKYINFKFIAGADGVKVLKPHAIYDPKFFFFLIQTVKIEDKGYARHFQFLEKAEIPLPPLSEQTAIVSKIEELLSDLENGKQQLLTAQAQLKVYRQSLLKWAFEGKSLSESGLPRLKDEQDVAKSNKNSINHFKNSENQVNPTNPDSANKLPKGWKWVKLGDVASKITDGEHITPRRTSDGILLLSARNIQNGHLALKNVDYIPIDEYERIIKRCNPEYGDILISCSGSIGRVCRVPLNLKFTLVRSVALVKFDWLKSSSKFYEYLFQSPLLQSQIEKSKKATAQANLFLGPIKNLDVIVCSLEEQTRIVEELESKLTICDKIEETISKTLLQAETLRQSILKKAFEGRLV